MALPPKGDPRRPLHLAIRSTRNFGVFFVLVGSFAATRIVLTRAGQKGVIFVPSPAVLLAWLLYLVPGTLFLLFSVFVVVINLVIDVIYVMIDPRIRFGRVEA